MTNKYYSEFFPAGDGVLGTTTPNLTENRIEEILDDLDLILDDNTLSRDEKLRTIMPLDAELATAYTNAVAIATGFGVSYSDATTKKNAWDSYKTSLSPAWNDTSQNTTINRTDFRTNLKAYMDAVNALQAAITVEASRRANVDRIYDGSTQLPRSEIRTPEGVAYGILNQGALAIQDTVNWSSQVVSRPPELTDGRIIAGLDISGRIRNRIAYFEGQEVDLTTFQDLSEPYAPTTIGIDAPSVSNSQPETLQVFLARLPVYPEQFKLNTDPDDTLSVQRALNSGREVILKDGKDYQISSTLTINTSHQKLSGKGRLVATGNFDLLLITGGCIGVNVDIISHSPSQTGGWTVKVSNADRVTIRCYGINVYGAIYVERCNVCTIPWAYFSCRGPGIKWYGNSSIRSDLLHLNEVTIGLYGAEHYGLDWDGNCHSLEIKFLAIVNAYELSGTGRGVIVRNTSGGPNPLVSRIEHIELDYIHGHGIEFVAPAHDCDIMAPYIHACNGGSAIKLSSTGDGEGSLRIHGGKIDSNGRYAIENAGSAPVYTSGTTQMFLNALGDILGDVRTKTPRVNLDTQFYVATSGGNPLLGFDPNDYLLYSRSGNELSLTIEGVNYFRTDSTRIYHPGKIQSPILESPLLTLDSTGYIGLFGGNPIYNFDANDYLSFTRSTNSLNFVINGINSVQVTEKGIMYDGTPNIPVERFGAVAGNSAIDNTAAIAAAEAAAAAVNGVVVFRAGQSYYFKGTLTAARNSLQWLGRETKLIYNGTSTTRNLFEIGEGTSHYRDARVTGIEICSLTTMTAGTAVYARKLVRSKLEIELQGQDFFETNGNKLWNGIWFDHFDMVNVDARCMTAQNDVIRVNGGVGAAAKADIWLNVGKVLEGQNGLLIGGAAGGVYVGVSTFVNNQTHIRVNQSLSAEENREILLNGTVLDVTKSGGDGLLLDDPGFNQIQITGVWIASAGRYGIWIKQCGGNVTLGGGYRIYNNANDGVRVDTAAAVVVMGSGQVNSNGLSSGTVWGINPNIAGHRVIVAGAQLFSNGSTLDRNVNTTYEPAQYSYFNRSYTKKAEFDIANFNNILLDNQFTLYKAGGNPIIGLDANDYLAFDRSNDLFVVNIASTPAFSINGSTAIFNTTLNATQLGIDSQAIFAKAGGNPYLGLDANDYISYDRTLNSYSFVIGGVGQLIVSGSALSTPLGITAAQFAGSGAALTNLQATALTGTINIARLTAGLQSLEGLTGSGVVTFTGTDVAAMRAIGVANATDIADRASADTRYARIAATNTFTANQIIQPGLTNNSLTIQGGAGNAYLTIGSDVNYLRALEFKTDTRRRWLFSCENALEPGGNVGSDWLLGRYNDGGSYIGVTMRASRATGIVTFEAIPTVNGTSLARLTDLTWTNISGKPSTFTPSAHTHAAADIVSGTIDWARLPVQILRHDAIIKDTWLSQATTGRQLFFFDGSDNYYKGGSHYFRDTSDNNIVVVEATKISLNKPVKKPRYTVNTLPTASSFTDCEAIVTDALSPTFGAIVVTGGSVLVPVYSDGSNWRVG